MNTLAKRVTRPVKKRAAAVAPKPPATLAKYAPPRAQGLLGRARLHDRLDTLRRQQTAIWLHAPAGAGKTALAAAWLEQSNTPAIWYRVDPLDQSTDVLFEYLGKSVPNVTLPMLAGELRNDVSAFARRFFALYFAALPAGSALVLDDVHLLDFASQSELLQILFASVPAGITVVATSRQPPPAALQDCVAVLDWDAIRFDADETMQLAEVGTDDAAARLLLAKTEGWAAAIVLLRRQLGSASVQASFSHMGLDQSGIFTYLATELFEQLAPAFQHAMLAVSLMPDITEAEALSLLGDANGLEVLTQIHRDGLLVEKRAGDPPRYVLHSLLRDFLATQIALLWTRSEHATMQARAAALLHARGAYEIAAPLYATAGAYAELIQLLKDWMPSIGFDSGFKAWMHWYDQIDANLREQDAWLEALRGNCFFELRDDRAQAALASAEQALRAQDDVLGVVDTLCWQIVHISRKIHFSESSVDTLSPVVLRLLEILPAFDLVNSDATRHTQAYAIASNGAYSCFKTTADFTMLAWRSIERLADMPDVIQRLYFIQFPLALSAILPPPLITKMLSEAIGAGGIDSLHELAKRNPGAVRGFLIRAHNTYFLMLGEFHHAQQCYDLCRDLQQEWQLPGNAGLVPNLMLARRQMKKARDHYEQYRLEFAMTKGQAVVNIIYLEALFAMHAGDYVGAFSRYSQSDAIHTNLMVSCFAALAGDYAFAFRFIDEQIDRSSQGLPLRNLKIIRLLISGDAAAQAGDMEAARTLLAEGLAMHRKDLLILFVNTPQLAERILDIALLLGIEKDHVLGIIRRQELRAPLSFMGHWPWPITVRTLGGFGLSFHGQAHVFKGKVPHKPLQILKALVQAPSRRQNLMSLAMTLWPEATDPLPAFQIALHRLRQLLGRDDAILLTESEVSLDAVVWNDFTALQDCAAHVRTLSADTPLHKLRRLSDVLCDLYRGPFLPQDEAEPWLVGARAQAVALFHETAVKLAAALEAQDDYASAQALYWQALDAEPLAEQSWRALMRCCHAQGDLAACARAWERCKQNLSILINRQPSQESRTLAASLTLAAV